MPLKYTWPPEDRASAQVARGRLVNEALAYVPELAGYAAETIIDGALTELIVATTPLVEPKYTWPANDREGTQIARGRLMMEAVSLVPGVLGQEAVVAVDALLTEMLVAATGCGWTAFPKYTWSELGREAQQIARGRLMNEALTYLPTLADKPQEVVIDAVMAELLSIISVCMGDGAPEPMTLYFRNLVPSVQPTDDPPVPQPDGGDIKPHRALRSEMGSSPSHFLDCTTTASGPHTNLVEHSCSFITEPLAAMVMPAGTWEINTAFTREGLGADLYELWSILHIRDVAGTWQTITTIASGERWHGTGTNLGSITCGRQQAAGAEFTIQDGDLIVVKIGFRVSTIFGIGPGNRMRFSHDGAQELNGDGVNSPTGPTAAKANIVTPDTLIFL